MRRVFLLFVAALAVLLGLLMVPFCVIGDRLQRGEEAAKREKANG